VLAAGAWRYVDQRSWLIDDDPAGQPERLPGRYFPGYPHRYLLWRPVHCLLFPAGGTVVPDRAAVMDNRHRDANRDRGNGEQLGMEESDGAVIAGSLETPGIFGVIFDRHGSTLLRFLARRVDPAEAEDLLGEVFRIAFERRSAFERDRDSARPWLYGIAANVVAKHYRSEARRSRAMARVSARRLLDEDPAERAVAVADAGARWARVTDAIGTLPEAERQVLLLFAWEELSYDEIALALGVPVGTVRSRLSRGRARLTALTQSRDTADVPLTSCEAGGER
jgi:RNA polymerase sigma factor (sigma-70 family)